MLDIEITKNPRVKLRQIFHQVRGPKWFPHVPVGIMVFIAAASLIYATLGFQWRTLFERIAAGDFDISPTLVPPVVIGGGLLIMTFGLALRSRIAWNMALVLTFVAVINEYIEGSRSSLLLPSYLIVTIIVLLASRKSFNHANLAASTLFAASSIFMLFSYAMFGSLYLGSDFKPEINDLVTAFYYSTVTMSTVGYGDITPQTAEAKLFTVSIIVLGVAVLATSLTSIASPLINRSMQKIADQKANQMKRENHFVILGDSSLARNTYAELHKRGQPVTRVLLQKPDEALDENADVVIGDAGDAETLKIAGCDKAIATIAMYRDDADNAFAILAVRSLGTSGRTIAAVNNSANLKRVRLAEPDVVFSPQILGGELAAMFVCDEELKGDDLLSRIFHSAEAPA